MKTTSTHKKSTLKKKEIEILHSISDNNLKQLKSIFQNAPAAIAIFTGSNHRFIMANYAYQKQNNRTEKDLLGKTYHEVFPEFKGTGAYEILDNVFKTGETFTSSEYPALIDSNNNGIPTQCYFNFSFEALKNESDEIYGVMVMALDITVQVLANKKIEENELEIRKIKEHLELSIKAGKIGVWNWDAEKDNLYWNEEQKEMYGIEKSEELNNLKQFQSFVIPEDWERIILNIQGENIKLNQEYDFRIKRKSDGEIRWIKSKSKVLLDDIGNIKFISGVNIDITEQEKVHKKIEESEQRYHSMFMNSPFAFSIMKGKEMKITLANELIKEFWGKGNNVEGKTLLEVLPELKNQPFPAMIDSVYTTGVPVYANEILAQLNRNGVMEDRYFNIVYEPYLEANKTISGVITIAHEVTQQVLARKKIEESEYKYQNLIFTSPYMIAIFQG
jgi:PAS domain S-box-containing protein